MFSRLGFCVFLGAILLAATVRADDAKSPWSGHKILARDGGKVAVNGEDVTDFVSWPATVTVVNGDWLWVGRGWIAKHDAIFLEDAPAYYTEFIRKDPEDTFGYAGRANAFSNLGEPDKAIADYTEAIRLFPGDDSFYNNRGTVFSDKGDFNRAIADFSEAIRLDPRNAKALSNRAAEFTRKHDYERAIADYNEAIRLDPRNAITFNNRGNMYRDKGDYDKALADYNEAIQLDPRYATTYGNRGLLRRLQGDFAKAVADYDEAIRLDPEVDWHYNRHAWLRATCPDEKYRDGKVAIESATKACELTKWKDADSISTLAAACAESGDFNAAIRWEEKAIAMTSDRGVLSTLTKQLALFKDHKPVRE